MELLVKVLAYYGGSMFLYYGFSQVVEFFDKDTPTTSDHQAHMFVLMLSVVLALLV
tara:strand:- start:176 stop:343 length:168 start_codon:yes stop_codon:yes gene_type:complete